MIEKEKTIDLGRKDQLQRRGIVVMSLMLLGLIGLTWLIEFLSVDLRVSRWAFSETENWSKGHLQPWRWMLEYGTIPGFISTLLALLGWYVVQRNHRWHVWGRYLLVYGMVSVVGAGILVNAILKEHSGRPRPREIIQFKGGWEYLPALEFGTPGKGRSFPCGHCTMGFLFSTGIVFWQRSKVLGFFLLCGGLVFGTMISAGRVLQGGHFVSDVLWSLGVLWVTLALLYYFVFQPSASEKLPYEPLSPTQQRRLLLGLIMFLTVLSGLYVTRRPFYQDYQHQFPVFENTDFLILKTNLNPQEIVLTKGSSLQGKVFIEGRGFALPDSEYHIDFKISVLDNEQTIELRLIPEGYFSELETRMQLYLPGNLSQSTRIEQKN